MNRRRESARRATGDAENTLPPGAALYHWDVVDPVTETRRSNRWEAWSWGRDRVLVDRRDGAVTAFSVGPSTVVGDRRERLAALIPDPFGTLASFAFCHQVHGSDIHVVPPPSGHESRVASHVLEIGDGDGLVTTSPGTGLVVWTADCVPVLIVGEGVVAAVHSGWRGCAADVLGAAIDRMRDVNGVRSGDLRVVLGPAVCGRCYRVGSEVIDALGRTEQHTDRWLSGEHVDLRGFLTSRAEALGVPPERIETVGGCTVESPALASYRRDGAAAGRQWAMVYLEG